MTTKAIVFSLASLFVLCNSADAGRVTPPNIPVEITVDLPAIDPALGELILTGINAATGRTTGRSPMAGPEGGERSFQGDLLILPPGQAALRGSDVYNPIYAIHARPGLDGPDLSYLNRFRAYFSSASGGFGLRIGYDRRFRPDLRLTAGTELLTYGYHRASDILGAQLPANVTRITLVSVPFGIQQQFGSGNRVVPHIGIAVGPIIRFDHHPGLAPGFYPSNTDVRTGWRSSSLELTIRPFEDFPRLSLTLGGFVEAGTDVRLGANRDLSLTVAGRYGLARFPDALGNPGDFSGLSLSVGFGKYF
jgi:hypothetical protein